MRIKFLPTIESLTYEKEVVLDVLETLKKEKISIILDDDKPEIVFVFAHDSKYIQNNQNDIIFIPSKVNYTPLIKGYFVYENQTELKLLLLSVLLKDQKQTLLKFQEGMIFLNEQKLTIDAKECPYFDQHIDIKTLKYTIELYEALSKTSSNQFNELLEEAKSKLKTLLENVSEIVLTYDYVLQVDYESETSNLASKALEITKEHLNQMLKNELIDYDLIKSIFDLAIQLEKEISSKTSMVTLYCQFLEDVYLPFLNENQDNDLNKLANMTHQLALSFTKDLRYQDAEYYQSQAVKLKQTLLKQSLEDEDLKVSLAQSYENMSYLHMIEQRLIPALDFNRKALDIYLGLDHDKFRSEIANLYLSIAILEDSIDEKKLAKAHFLEAKSFKKNEGSLKSKVFMAKVYSNLGSLYFRLEDKENAQASYEQALQEYRYLALIHLKKYHKSLATILYMLALIHHQNNEYELATQYFKEAIHFHEIEPEKEVGTQTFDFAKSLNGLAVLYKDLNQYDDAKTYFKQALLKYQKLDEASPKAYDAYIGDIYGHLGDMFKTKNDQQEAVEAYQKALELYMRHAQARPQQFYMKLALIHKSLASLYIDLERYEKAANHFEDLLYFYDDMIKFNFSRHALDLVDIYIDYAKVEYQLNHLKPSMNYAKKAIKLSQKVFKEQPHESVTRLSNAHHQLASTLVVTNKDKKANKVTQTRINLLNRHLEAYPNIDAKKRIEWLRALCEAYKMTNNEEDAVVCQRKADQLEIDLKAESKED
jgi:tetratricopeptide (TPR) repeat protein